MCYVRQRQVTELLLIFCSIIKGGFVNWCAYCIYFKEFHMCEGCHENKSFFVRVFLFWAGKRRSRTNAILRIRQDLKGELGFASAGFCWTGLVPCMRSGFSVADWNYLEGKDCSSVRFRKSKDLAAWKPPFRSWLIYISPRRGWFRRRGVLLKWGDWEIYDIIFERELHVKLVVDLFSFEHRPKPLVISLLGGHFSNVLQHTTHQMLMLRTKKNYDPPV